MESSEEVAVAIASYSSNGSSGVECDYAAAVASFTKRKRTKRLRTSSSSSSSPPPPPPPNEEEEEDYFSTSSTTEEEEDMAHCLILLAQGRTAACPSSSPAPLAPPREEKFTSRKFAEATTTATGAKAGFYVYECKTCNKCFPSFQALGGHRASHKKPKLQVAAVASTASETTPPAVKAADIDHHDGHGRLETMISSTMNSSSLAAAGTAPAPNNKLCRVHECSICGSEFASGQALGGHMRRHRPVGAVSAAAAPESPREEAVINSTSSSPCKKEDQKKKKRKKCMLSLDLNLPAPSEDQNPGNPMAAVVFAGFTDQRPLALVDCHY